MKKIFFLFVVILMSCGMVWAQGYIPPIPNIPAKPASRVFPGFDAIGISSVENSHAPGFITMVEDYMDPAFYNPNIGTFLLLGGGSTILDQSISFGVGKTIGPVYAAGYYKGGIFQTIGIGGSGVSQSNPGDNGNVYRDSSITWNNNIALLFGIAGMGFRLDVIDNNQEDTKTTYDGNYTLTTSVSHGPRIALSWGSRFGSLYPWAKIGFKVPNVTSVGGVNFADPNLGADYGKNAALSSSGAFNFEAGALYDFSGGDFTSTLVGIMTFGTQFKDKYTGDTEVITNLAGYDNGIAAGREYDYGGAWGIDLYLYYRKTFGFGKFSMKVTPNIRMNVMSESHDFSIVDVKNPRPTWFTLEPGVTLGVQFQALPKLAFYSGIDLRILEWDTYATPGGDTKNDITSWELEGVRWNMGRLFGLGMAWTPIEGLVVATSLTGILDAFFIFDVQNMSIRSGSIFNSTGSGNVGDWAMVTLGKMFSSFRLTVTYTF